MNVNERTVQRLRDFTERLERGEPITAYMVRRIDTPDGPMHVSEPVVLEPFCMDCGEDLNDCRCQRSDA